MGTATRLNPIRVQLVSGEYFGVLRQIPQAGRLLTVDDNVNPGQHPVAVISDAYWSRRFGRARSALGSELRINGALFTVVGIGARGFFGTTVGASYADLWLPVMMQAEVRYAGRMTATSGDERQAWARQRGISWLNIILRVSPANVEAVSDALTTIARHESTLGSSLTEASTQQSPHQHRVTLTPAGRGLSELRAEVTAPLFVLLAMVVLLLAITCANVASLLVARAVTRQREIAIRISIGAGRGRLVRQLLTESLFLSVLGAGLGLLVTHWGIGTRSRCDGGQRHRYRPGLAGRGVHPDRGSRLWCGLRPAAGAAWHACPSRERTHIANPRRCWRHRGPNHHTGPGRRPDRALAVPPRDRRPVRSESAGAAPRRRRVRPRAPDRGTHRSQGWRLCTAELPDLHRRLIERIEAMPGVTSASLSSNPPFSGARVRSGFEVEGYVRSGDEQLSTQEEQVTIGYFQTVGLRLLQGRTFGPEDTARTRRVSVISATMARRLFPNQDAVGKRWGGSTNFDVDAFEIVGVVEDARYNDLKHAPPNMVYLLAAQSDQYLNGIEVRVAGRPVALVKALRASLTETEPRLPIAFVRTLDEQVRGTIGSRSAPHRAHTDIQWRGALPSLPRSLRHDLLWGVAPPLGTGAADGAWRAPQLGGVARDARGALAGRCGTAGRAASQFRRGANDAAAFLRDHDVRWPRARERGADPAGHRRPGGVHPGAPRVTARSDACAQGGTMRRRAEDAHRGWCGSTKRLMRGLSLAALFVAATVTPARADWTFGAFIGGALTRASSIHLAQNQPHTDLVLSPVHYRSESFDAPIYYGYRAGVFPRSGWLGVEGEFIHLKVIADTTRMTSVTGVLNGRPVSEPRPLEDVVQRFAITHGVNLVLANVVARYMRAAARPSVSRLILSGRFGVGASIPHAESTIADVSREQYEWGALSLQGAGGVEFRLTKRLYLTGEYKFTRTVQEVSVVNGTVRTPLRTHHLVAGVSGHFGASR